LVGPAEQAENGRAHVAGPLERPRNSEAVARPPAPPEDLLLAPIAGGAGAEVLELTSADGTHFSAALAEASAD
jgi:hypothetical protein